MTTNKPEDSLCNYYSLCLIIHCYCHSWLTVICYDYVGSGKTTLLSQLSLDFAKEGAPTLWGSFEIKNNRLVHKMLQQSYKHGSLSNLSDTKLHQIANDFEALPLLFMNFHGSTAIDEVS